MQNIDNFDTSKFFSREAEAALVGSMIINPDCVPKVLSLLPRSDLFYLPENQTIFEALVKLHFAKTPIDPILLRDELKKEGKLDKLKGTSEEEGVLYIGEVVESVTSSALVDYYAKIVLKEAKSRKLWSAAEQIRQVANESGDPDEKIPEIQRIAMSLDTVSNVQGDCQPVCINLADVTPRPIEWLWFERFPKAMLSLIIGDPGLGKSWLTLDMAARISTGRPWPDSPVPGNIAPLGSVVILTAEDHLEFTVRPRLDKLGAHAAKIIAIKGVRSAAGDEYFDVTKHVPALENAIVKCKDVQAVIVDPITAYLGNTDSHKNAEVRAALALLSDLAEKRSVAVVCVSHLNKAQTTKVIYRTMGSVAFNAAARAVWLLAIDKDDEKRRLLVPVKMNLCEEQSSLAFRIVDGHLDFETKPLLLRADEVLGIENTEERTVRDDAKEWLRDLLSDGRVRSTEVMELADREKIAKRTLDRAKNELGVRSEAEGFGKDKIWWWSMP
jgi:hypothetical protein